MKDIHASFYTIGASDERSLKGGKKEQQSLSPRFNDAAAAADRGHAVATLLKCRHTHKQLTSNNGPICWQGPHHDAVKSTTTNLSPLSFRIL